MKRVRRLPAVGIVLVMVAIALLPAAPARAGTLTAATFSMQTAYSRAGTVNAAYDYSFTTASTAILSKVTMTVPSGTVVSGRYLALNGTASNYASTPDSPANSVTGDLDLRIRVALDNWTNGSDRVLLAKRSAKYSYQVWVDGSGHLLFGWTSDGSGGQGAMSTATIAVPNGTAVWLRATLDVDNGFGDKAISFYTSIDGSAWSALGSSVVQGGTTSVFDGPDPVEVGSNFSGAGNPVQGRIYRAQIHNGIDGPVVARFDPNDTTSSAPSSWQSAGPSAETWTVNRSGTNLPADVQADLTAYSISGLPTGGSANYRYLDAVATYQFSATNVVSATPCSVTLQGFTNTTTPGVYPSIITTYDNAGTPTAVDSVTAAGGTVVSGSSNIAMSIRIDPQLTFSISGRPTACNAQSSTNFQAGSTSSSVNLGRLSVSSLSDAAQNISITTNASDGFNVYVRTSGATPHSFRDTGGRSIADVAGTAASPSVGPVAGTPGFGFTSDDPATAFTANKWAKLTNVNAAVLVGAPGVLTKSGCVGFEAAIGASTTAGAYSTTVIYTVVPSY